MRKSPGLIIAVLLCLMLVQLSGLHTHVAVDLQDDVLHGTHVHQQSVDEHGHEGDVDVSIFELGTPWAKLIFLLPPFILALLLAVPRVQHTWIPPARRATPRRRPRWRPLLRAPPVSFG